MKFGTPLLALCTALGITTSAGQCNTCETYRVPLASAPADEGFEITITITVVFDGTIIYYDEWEDGYDAGPCPDPFGFTQIWGDGDASNGIPPGSTVDILTAGTVIVLDNVIPLPRGAGAIYFDGQDEIRASKPIRVTRTAIELTPVPGTPATVNVLSTGRCSSCPKRPVQDRYFPDYAILLGSPNPLKCCMNQPNPPPNGRNCAPSQKVCLWGEQVCPDGSFRPTTRCDCPGNPNNQWSCNPVVC